MQKAAPNGTASVGSRRCQRPDILDSLDVANGDLAGATIFLGVERDLLAFAETAHTCALECCCVDENVLAAVIRLDKAEAFLIVVEFNCADLHDRTLRLITDSEQERERPATNGHRFLEIV